MGSRPHRAVLTGFSLWCLICTSFGEDAFDVLSEGEVAAGVSDTRAGSENECGCVEDELLDKDCCACTVKQVAEAASSYFKGILTQVVETAFFRLYTPYPEQANRELYDVECSIPEFRELENQLSASQLGCAIEQCGCQEAECSGDHWRQQPCFVQCEEGSRLHEESVLTMARTIPADADGDGPVRYDLLENPEQFTGYGTLLDDRSARMIWDSLYTDRFCFACPEEASSEVSAEKRLVYKVVSGLQSSINTHIAMHYGLYADTGEPATRENWDGGRPLSFGPWKQLFDERVGAHPDRIRNMHFVFALLLRALHRLHPHLDRVLEVGRSSCSKCAAQHNATLTLVHRLLSPPDHAPEECDAVLSAFNDSTLFVDAESSKLREEVRTRFQRMGELMTCVGCDRCKLWGTLQFHAARVAVGILTDASPGARREGAPRSAGGAGGAGSHYAVPSVADLRPNDVIALVNALAQVSKSIDQAREWTERGRVADEL